MYSEKFSQFSFIKFIKKVSHSKVTTSAKYGTSKKNMPCKQNALCKDRHKKVIIRENVTLMQN